MLIIDGHLDMAFNALFNRRDLTQPIDILREREDGVEPDGLSRRPGPLFRTPGTVTVSLPEMRQGHVGIMLSTVMSRVQVSCPKFHNSVRTQIAQIAAHARGQSHLAYYQALERAGEITWIKTLDELDACVTAWEDPTPETPLGLILTMESADSILGPDNVQEWWEVGLRSVCLTHFGANTYGHGTGTVGGLYSPAYPLMDAFRGVGIALDLTHASDLTFWQILDYWDGPVHASRSIPK